MMSTKIITVSSITREYKQKGLSPSEFLRYRYKKVYVATPKMKDYKKRYSRVLKTKVISHYGGKCACCGEGRIQFLTIDHVNNDGAEHRKQISSCKGGSRFYQWLIKNNFPEEPKLQLLCWNCNLAKKIYGICPHQEVANALPTAA